MAIKIELLGREIWLSPFWIQERKDFHLREGEESMKIRYYILRIHYAQNWAKKCQRRTKKGQNIKNIQSIPKKFCLYSHIRDWLEWHSIIKKRTILALF